MTAPRKEVLAEGIELWLGDCREVLPMIGKVDAVVTDPPYGIGVEYGTFVDTKENVATLAKEWLPLALIAAKRVVFTPGNINMHNYPCPTWTMAWITPAGIGSGPWGFSCWQPIMCYGKDPFLQSAKGRAPDIIQHTEASEINGHPCPKPVIFMQRLLDRVSLNGEKICDPFTGSGTTAVASICLGRKFVGIEIELKYFDIACRRINEALKQPQLFIDVPEPTKRDRLDIA